MIDRQITTVIPTSRRPRLLRRAIESALGQTHSRVIVAVFDNASGDETAEVVGELARRDPRVCPHCHPRNLGAALNFQAGRDAVDTPYFSFLSDDDLLLSGFYEHALPCLRNEPRARFFCGQTVIYDPELGRHYLRPTARHWSDGFYEGRPGDESDDRDAVHLDGHVVLAGGPRQGGAVRGHRHRRRPLHGEGRGRVSLRGLPFALRRPSALEGERACDHVA